jgi:hypothetical protein
MIEGQTIPEIPNLFLSIPYVLLPSVKGLMLLDPNPTSHEPLSAKLSSRAHLPPWFLPPCKTANKRNLCQPTNKHGPARRVSFLAQDKLLPSLRQKA